MPRRISRTRNTQVKKEQAGILGKIKLAESYTSLILGAIVVLIIGIFFLSFAKVNRHGQTSSVMMQTPKNGKNYFRIQTHHQLIRSDRVMIYGQFQ